MPVPVVTVPHLRACARAMPSSPACMPRSCRARRLQPPTCPTPVVTPVARPRPSRHHGALPAAAACRPRHARPCPCAPRRREHYWPIDSQPRRPRSPRRSVSVRTCRPPRAPLAATGVPEPEPDRSAVGHDGRPAPSHRSCPRRLRPRAAIHRPPPRCGRAPPPSWPPASPPRLHCRRGPKPLPSQVLGTLAPCAPHSV